YEMGYQIGSHFREKITRFVNSSSTIKKFRGKVDRGKYESLMEFADGCFHNYMEEIRGVSDGSGIDFMDLVLLNFKYEDPIFGCSIVIFKTEDKIYLGHNEDGERENEDKAVFLIAKPHNGTPFFAYCYPGMIPGNAFSFNAHGLVMTGNAMPTPDPKIGIPRHLIDRSMLEASSIEDALERALLPQRASGFSYNLVSIKERKAINLETTSQMHFVTQIDKKFFHTNHYVSIGLRDVAQRISESSRIRYEHGIKMISGENDISEKSVLKILFSEQNKPNSIYASGGIGNSWTLCTAVFELSDDINLKVYARKERRCQPLTFSTGVFE
ncbi:MAG: C45 family autoproteolytic acyltransferase/hydrolase, partial [Thermoproteota archaeon]